MTAASSWLPFYHDMGLVGCMMSMIANQVSVDYLKTEDFARRPLAWLDLITAIPATSCLLFADLRLRHLRAPHLEPERTWPSGFDLSRWRIAGNGADMIRPT